MTVCWKCGALVKNLRGLSAHDRKHRREEAGYTANERAMLEAQRPTR